MEVNSTPRYNLIPHFTKGGGNTYRCKEQRLREAERVCVCVCVCVCVYTILYKKSSAACHSFPLPEIFCNVDVSNYLDV